jgi:dihydrofolate synthase/folylpolyglutamate synthase
MPHWPIKFNQNPHRIDLAPIKKLLELLDNPHKKLPPVIHVAGTNGKGSSSAMLNAIFKAAGYKTHLYTSPHIREFNERIVIGGDRISDVYLFDILEQIRAIYEKENLDNSFFEITTAAAFLAFAENDADVTIIETGLGGRLDATNIIEDPLATIITPISIEHSEYLGPNTRIIAGEKAGIIKPGSPCIISAQEDVVFDVLLGKCEEMAAPSIAFLYDFMIEKLEDGFSVEGRDFSKTLFPSPNLLGDHQILNAGVIIAGILSGTFEGFNITKGHIESGILNIKWPARIEKIKIKNKEIILDGAHNESGSNALAHWARDNLSSGKISLILGMTNNRDVLSFAAPFKDLIDNIFTVQVKSEASAYMPEKMAELLKPLGMNIISCDDLEEAIEKASKSSDHIIVTGSLFLAADVYKL